MQLPPDKPWFCFGACIFYNAVCWLITAAAYYPATHAVRAVSYTHLKLFCGYCGALMFGESGTSRTGEVHRYYKCATAKKHKGCKKKTVRKPVSYTHLPEQAVFLP